MSTAGTNFSIFVFLKSKPNKPLCMAITEEKAAKQRSLK